MNYKNAMWTERYRPKTLDEIVGHDRIIERLEQYVGDGEVPHMLFAGPSGVGKTATITAFAREEFGSAWESNFHELNASDERGIDTIRDKVKGFARSSPVGESGYKIIFLDEADQLSSDAQPALRRIIEDYADITRFFLSCNYQRQIIPALQSRCSVFRFQRLADEDVKGILVGICEEEEIDYEDVALQHIVQEAGGDARSAINSLQSSVMDGEVTEESVEVVVGVVNYDEIEEITELAISGDLDGAMLRLDTVIKEGATVQQLADTFLSVLKNKDMPAPGKAKCIDKLAEVEWRCMNAANPQVQWHSFLTDLNVGYHLTLENYEP